MRVAATHSGTASIAAAAESEPAAKPEPAAEAASAEPAAAASGVRADRPLLFRNARYQLEHHRYRSRRRLPAGGNVRALADELRQPDEGDAVRDHHDDLHHRQHEQQYAYVRLVLLLELDKHGSALRQQTQTANAVRRKQLHGGHHVYRNKLRWAAGCAGELCTSAAASAAADPTAGAAESAATKPRAASAAAGTATAAPTALAAAAAPSGLL